MKLVKTIGTALIAGIFGVLGGAVGYHAILLYEGQKDPEVVKEVLGL